MRVGKANGRATGAVRAGQPARANGMRRAGETKVQRQRRERLRCPARRCSLFALASAATPSLRSAHCAYAVRVRVL
jgi:hypothetical protein